jgi:lysophospholipase L1-like esterase
MGERPGMPYAAAMSTKEGAMRQLRSSALWLVVAAATLAAGATASTSSAPQRYYLALGDSIAYGFQPDSAGAPPAAIRGGYVDVFAARLRRLSPDLEVVNYGCPGESTVTFVRGGCPWLADGRKLHDPFRRSQLDAALAFLRTHPGEVSPITLTLWGNDVFPLSQQGDRAAKAISAVGSRLSSILRRLRSAAPAAEIIVTGAWNPEADRLAPADPLYRSLQAAIARAAAASHARVADMFGTFNGSGNPAARKARLCAKTFSCRGDPHPTDAGYRAMADAFMAASGYPRKP